jgi:hypothetical protein
MNLYIKNLPVTVYQAIKKIMNQIYTDNAQNLTDIRPEIRLVRPRTVFRPDTGYLKKAGLSGRPDIRCISISTSTQL